MILLIIGILLGYCISMGALAIMKKYKKNKQEKGE